jgi:hypothetical protein
MQRSDGVEFFREIVLKASYMISNNSIGGKRRFKIGGETIPVQADSRHVFRL